MFNFSRKRLISSEYNDFKQKLYNELYTECTSKEDFITKKLPLCNLLFFIITQNFVGLHRYTPRDILFAKMLLSQYNGIYDILKTVSEKSPWSYSLNSRWSHLNKDPFDSFGILNFKCFTHKSHCVTIGISWYENRFLVDTGSFGYVCKDDFEKKIIIYLSVTSWMYYKNKIDMFDNFRRSVNYKDYL